MSGSILPAVRAGRRLACPAAMILSALLVPLAGASAQDSPARRGAPPGWVGFWYQGLPGAGDPPLVVVHRVQPGSPAERAGLGAGDTLVAVDGVSPTAAVFRSMGRDLRVGDRVRLTLRREGTLRHVDVTAAARPRALADRLETVTDSAHRVLLADVDSLRARVLRSPPRAGAPRAAAAPPAPGRPRIAAPGVLPPEPALPAEGLRQPFHAFVLSAGDSLRRDRDAAAAPAPGFRPLAPYLAGRDRVAGARLTRINDGLAGYFGTERGLLVVEVPHGTPAHEAGLRPGDVLLEVAGTAVSGMDDLRAALARAPVRPVPLEVLRRGRAFELRLP